MKMLRQFGQTIVLIIALVFTNGCKKGKDGEPGKDGSANVVAHTYSVSSWINGTSYWYTDLSFPELTPDNINSASVQVYFGTAANTWKALPYTQYSSTNYWMLFETTPGNINIQWWYNGFGTGSSPVAFYSGATSQFKVVIIPPSVMIANPGVDWRNYEEVKEKFNLKD